MSSLSLPNSRIEQIARCMSPGVVMEVRMLSTSDIDERMSIIIEEILTGMKLPQIRSLIGEVLGRRTPRGWIVNERDWLGEVKALHTLGHDVYKALYQAVRERVRYTRDTHRLELFQRPDRTLELKIGDCDDLTILLGALYMACGYAVILRIIAINGGPYQHIYLVVGSPPEEPQEWIPVDPSRPEGPGWEFKENVTKVTDYLVDMD